MLAVAGSISRIGHCSERLYPSLLLARILGPLRVTIEFLYLRYQQEVRVSGPN